MCPARLWSTQKSRGVWGHAPPPPFLVCFRCNFLHTIIAFPFEFTVEIELWSRRYCDVIIMCHVLIKDRWHDNSRATLTRIIRCWRLAVLDVFSSAEGFSEKIFYEDFILPLPRCVSFGRKHNEGRSIEFKYYYIKLNTTKVDFQNSTNHGPDTSRPHSLSLLNIQSTVRNRYMINMWWNTQNKPSHFVYIKMISSSILLYLDGQ